MTPTDRFVEAMRPLFAEYGERQWDHGPSPKELIRRAVEAFADEAWNPKSKAHDESLCDCRKEHRAALLKEVFRGEGGENE